MTQPPGRFLRVALAAVALSGAVGLLSRAATNKPPLHAKKWLAITGKPLGATAGAMIFQKGGNAVDAAAAMIAATATMWDTLSWGGETQALIYNPKTGKVVGINALGVAPTGATPEFFRGEGHGVSARVRPARRRHARNARRDHGDARRVRHALPRRRPRARDRHGGRLPRRAAARRPRRNGSATGS